jgi:hypothetical protein
MHYFFFGGLWFVVFFVLGWFWFGFWLCMVSRFFWGGGGGCGGFV